MGVNPKVTCLVTLLGHQQDRKKAELEFIRSNSRLEERVFGERQTKALGSSTKRDSRTEKTQLA